MPKVANWPVMIVIRTRAYKHEQRKRTVGPRASSGCWMERKRRWSTVRLCRRAMGCARRMCQVGASTGIRGMTSFLLDNGASHYTHLVLPARTLCEIPCAGALLETTGFEGPPLPAVLDVGVTWGIIRCRFAAGGGSGASWDTWVNCPWFPTSPSVGSPSLRRLP